MAGRLPNINYNAAKNIGLGYLRRNQTGGDGGAPLGVRLNSGTLTVKGGYSPAEESARTGVHAESHDFSRGWLNLRYSYPIMDEMDVDHLKQARDRPATSTLSLPTDELCERFEALYTGAVSDALREMGRLNQSLPPRIEPLNRDMTIAGIAFTVKSAPDPTIEGEMTARAAMLDDLDTAESPVVVWDADDDHNSTQWGEVMTTAALERGCRGAIIDGGIRDTHGILEQPFDIWYSYRSPNGALARSRLRAYGTTIEIDGVLIHHGDIVVADIDGAVVVPRDIVDEVLERAESIADTDNEVQEWVAEGLSTEEVVDRGGYF